MDNKKTQSHASMQPALFGYFCSSSLKSNINFIYKFPPHRIRSRVFFPLSIKETKGGGSPKFYPISPVTWGFVPVMQEIDFNIHTEAICFIIPIFFRVEDFVNDSPTICSHVLLSCIDVFQLPPCNIQKTESEVTICQSNLLKPLVNIFGQR